MRLLLSCDDKTTDNARPSVETHFHALLDKCVIHLHPEVIGAYVNAKSGKTKIETLFKNGTSIIVALPTEEDTPYEFPLDQSYTPTTYISLWDYQNNTWMEGNPSGLDNE